MTIWKSKSDMETMWERYTKDNMERVDEAQKEHLDEDRKEKALL